MVSFAGCLRYFIYCNDQVLSLLQVASNHKMSSIYVFADLQGLQVSEAPQATIPFTLLITPYRPHIVVYNSAT